MSSVAVLTSRVWPWVQLTRMHLVVGFMLLFWTFAWGLTMAAYSLQMQPAIYVKTLLTGLVGSALSHSAGCIWNDIVDRDIDRQVERTKKRPIADGRISVPGALGFLLLHVLILFGLCWRIEQKAWYLGLAWLFPLTGIYPWLKRVTYWPQAWLGIAMNMGIPFSWLLFSADCPSSSYVLLLGAWAWTLWYDTIYACQDKEDDGKVGVKSTALQFGKHIRSILAVFGFIFVGCITFAGYLNQQSTSYYAIAVGATTVYLVGQLCTVDLDSSECCRKAFIVNALVVGGLVWLGALIDYVYQLRQYSII